MPHHSNRQLLQFAKRFFCLMVFLAPSQLWAQDIPAAPSSTDVFTNADSKPLWEAGIAGAVGVLSDYPGSDRYQTRALPLPYFVYRGGVLRADESGTRLQTRKGNVEFEFSGGGTLSSNSRSGPRQGMPRLDYLLESGPSAKITLNRPTAQSRVFIDLPLRAAMSTNFSSRADWRGLTLSPDLAYEDKAILGSPWGGQVAVGVQFATARFEQFYYQVDPEFARLDRPAYRAHGGYQSANVSFSVFRPIGPHVNIFFAGEMDVFSGAENTASPLLTSSTGFNGVVGFAWSIWQSSQREQPANRAARVARE